MNVVEAHYRANHDRLVKIIAPRLDRNYHISEECVQEAYCKAWEYYPRFEHSIKNYEAWFRTILNNVVNLVKGEERSRGIVTDEVDELAVGDELDQHYLHLSRKISEDIDEVEDIEHQFILDLYFNKHMKPKEIYYLVSVSKSGVRTIIQRFKEDILSRYDVLSI